MRALFPTLALAVLCGSALAAPGVGCVLVGQGQAGMAAPDGRSIPLPSRQADCSGLKVTSGSVTACFLDAKGARQCRSLRSGDEFSAARLGAAAGEGAFRATMTALLKGDGQVVAGQTRAVQRQPGLPYGNVAAMSGGIPIAPGLALGTFTAGTFSLRPVGQTTPESSWPLETSTALIPVEKLEPGREYSWTATGNDRKLVGRFRLATASETQRLREAIDAAGSTAGPDATARAILSAEVLAEKGFGYEASRLLEAMQASR